MDEDSQFGRLIKAALAATGLGAVTVAFLIPFPYGLYVAVLILVLAIVLFGGYFLWRRKRAQREREQFTSAIETQTAAAPKSISDPNKRADLDRVRQKFQSGLQEFKSRGKDIYKLPWYVIIGESGSGKTEAIRHSGIDFPPGLQDELQGSGGTVNMDWWFTNRGIILDTAGSMLFNEARAGESPEWREFLRLLKRARPQCPVNGLFLVLSIESLIRDSADTIAAKASRLAQQLDIIQRALDVRFPVYLLVTKCDLLTGFREFFDSIDDPLLQHQMFGWSNPDPLDSHFRSDLVEQHLRTVAARLRRRRMALIRDISGTGRLGDTQHFFASTYQLGRGPTVPRRLDEFDSLFALPESIMRLAPRLQRYLETIFVAGEWSAKPVFLRGIYFTSSMREGKALDEAIALATGLPLDQLPEDRSWEKNRAFFLRDLFHEKVFRESGLVTRATNTLKMLRRNQMIIFGSAGAALLLLLVFGGLANHKLKQSVQTEAAYWKAGAAHVKEGIWSPAIVSDTPAEGRYAYGGSNTVQVGSTKPTLVQYQQTLCDIATTNLPVPWIFRPMVWIGMGKVRNRPDAQRRLFEAAVIRPLVLQSQAKMRTVEPTTSSLSRHRDALLSLMDLEAAGLINGSKGGGFPTPNEPARYLKSFLSYLTESDLTPDSNLVKVFERTYAADRLRENEENWPPQALRGGNRLATNTAINIGLVNFDKVSRIAQTGIDEQLKLVNDLVDQLQKYEAAERKWLAAPADSCRLLSAELLPIKTEVDAAWKNLVSVTNLPGRRVTSLAALYSSLATAATNASASALSAPVGLMILRLPASEQGAGLFQEIKDKLSKLASGAAENILKAYNQRLVPVTSLDASFVMVPTNSSTAAFETRWSLYSNACELANSRVEPQEVDLGSGWKRFADLNRTADRYRSNLVAYNGPLALESSNACNRVAASAVQQLRTNYVSSYISLISGLAAFAPAQWSTNAVNAASTALANIETDIAAGSASDIPADQLAGISQALAGSRQAALTRIGQFLARTAQFPILLSAPRANSLPEAADLRNLLSCLAADLPKPVWHCKDCPLAATVGKYLAVIDAQVNTNGTGAEWELYFVPSSEPSLVNIYRAGRVTIGTQSSEWQDLSRAETKLLIAKGAANAPLRVAFKKLVTDPEAAATVAVDEPAWGLAGWIRSSKPEAVERLEEGRAWRFRVSPEPGGNTARGLVFEARLLHGSLPKREDWPKPE